MPHSPLVSTSLAPSYVWIMTVTENGTPTRTVLMLATTAVRESLPPTKPINAKEGVR